MTVLHLAIAAGVLALWTAALLVRNRWTQPAIGSAATALPHARPTVRPAALRLLVSRRV